MKTSYMRVAALTITVLVCVLANSACTRTDQGGGHEPPTWLLWWQPPKEGIDASTPPEVAFAQGASVVHFPGGQHQPPGAAIWLATSPMFGIALVQLDPAGQYLDVATVGVDPREHIWVENSTTIRNGQGCTGESRVVDNVVFPENICQMGTLHHTSGADYPGRYTLTSWISNTETFVVDHIASIPQRPSTGTTNVTIHSTPGWMLQEHGITSIILPLAGGEAFIFAGTANTTQSQNLATQVLAHLQEIAPL